MLKVVTCAAAALALGSFAAPAIAGPQTIAVDYTDLDLTTVEDVEILRDRIELAVQRVCRTQNYRAGMVSTRRCHGELMTEAMEQVDHLVEVAIAEGNAQLAAR